MFIRAQSQESKLSLIPDIEEYQLATRCSIAIPSLVASVAAARAESNTQHSVIQTRLARDIRSVRSSNCDGLLSICSPTTLAFQFLRLGA